MPAKLKEQGLLILLVRLNPEGDESIKSHDDIAKKFLKENKVALPNYLLDETEEFWQKKLGVDALPCMYVFNRVGQYEEKYTEKPDAKKLDLLIEKLLKEPGPK